MSFVEFRPSFRAALASVCLALASCGTSVIGLVDSGPSDGGAALDGGADGGSLLDGGTLDGGDGGTALDGGSSSDGGGAANPDGGASDAGTVVVEDAGPPQFGGGFAPDGGSGGFGGGNCTASKTPIVFLHGNGDNAGVWSRAASTGAPSVLAALTSAGYRDCELFGLTWLTPSEQTTPELIFHDAARAELVRSFLDQVRAYTGMAQVDIVAHSMGVTLALHALEGTGQDTGVRRFVAIAGALRGLQSCIDVGPADPLAPTCGSQSLADSDTFGFYPSSNARMEAGGFRDRPANSQAAYYSIRAGLSDEILCAGSAIGCDSALFDAASNVLVQLDVGEGTPTVAIDDDSSGVGHFRARSNSGALLVNLLTSSCVGAACCAGVSGPCAP